MLLASLCALLTACSDEVVLVDVPYEGDKTPIELYAGWADAEDNKAVTRTVITDDETKPHNSFPANTSLYMLMQSNYIGSGAAQPTKVTRTIMFALPQSDNTKDYSEVNYSASKEYDKFVRYWDDVYARDAAVSIVAACTPGMGPFITGQTNNKAWYIGGTNVFDKQEWTDLPAGITPEQYNAYATISWPVGSSAQIYSNAFLTDQSRTFDNVSYIKTQDLCFSNNLNDNTSKEHADGRLKFNQETRKFNAGKLIFYHALSKLTFRFKQGEGFADNEFQFNDNTNIKLTNFYSQGTFNLAEGEFVASTLKKANGQTGQNQPIAKIWQRTANELTTEEQAAYKYILDALVIPGTDMTTSDNAVTFYINHNEYKLTMAQLYAAFTDEQKTTYFDSNKLKAGVHYVFTFTVSKTQISGLTAQIVPWETVDAGNINASNARISLQLEDRGEAVISDVDFYRAKDTGNSTISDTYEGYQWATGYEKGTGSFNDNTWQPTNWYWPDNTTFYHFRAVGDKSTSSPAAPTVSSDAFTLTAGQNYKDYIWGAPFKELDGSSTAANDTKIVYSPTYGFDGTFDGTHANSHQIYHGIGPTNDPVKLLMFHMMSDITIKVQSVTGEAAVQLTNGDNKTTIHFENIYTAGSVALGNGLVSTTGSATTTSNLAMSSTDNQWLYGAIPQNLDGPTTAATDDVILVITTPDKNEYRVSMKDVAVTTPPTTTNLANPYTQSSGKYVIDRWYPGFKYTYTFTLKKTGITSLQATIADWEDITADNEDVQIK